MYFDKYPTLSIKGQTTPGDRALFVAAVNRIRHSVDVETLQLLDRKTEPVRANALHLQPGGTLIGRQYAVELSGEILPGEGDDDQQFGVWAKFTKFDPWEGVPLKFQIDELRLGLVPLGDNDFTSNHVAVDLIRYEYPSDFSPGKLQPLDGFPVEWRQFVAAQVMAVTLAQ